MRWNIVFGGPAGEGPNILTHIVAETLVEQGYCVFYSRDYQSLIRGGHNFNALTFSEYPVYSNDSKIDILICLDDATEEIHKKDLKKDSIILKEKRDNMYFAGRVFKLLCLDFKLLENKLKNIEKRFEENIKEAKQGYEEEKRTACKIVPKKRDIYFTNGSLSFSEGAIKSGLDIYYAYPMTPATPVLIDLAQKQIDNNYIVLGLENEIAVINAAIGSAITGAKSMIGTSGGGFDLMTEGLSLTGIAGVPLIIYLAQRPGPGTGVATYTAQGDLNIARHSGHGEFPRVVLAPGDPKECKELASHAFYFSQKFKIPVIVMSDKHLGESFYTLSEKAEIINSEKSTSLGRYNSYETDENGSATENPEIIKKNVELRNKKTLDIIKEAEKFEMYKKYEKKESKNVVVFWGSTKGAILDAIDGMNVEAIQILYIDPFPKKLKNEIKGKNIILVENNSTGLLSNLISEKIGIFIEEKILRYDGRPFLADELKNEIEKRLK